MGIYGVSANTQSKWDNSGSEVIGYKPQDNAEIYADTLLPSLKSQSSEKFHGGDFCQDGYEGDTAMLEDN
jgi:uronate dehydrogenase